MIYQTHGFNPTQPDPCGLGWVELDLYDGSGWFEFFFTHHGGLGQKISSTRPMHTPSFSIFIKTIFKICDDGSPYSLKPSFSTHSLQIYCLETSQYLF